MQITVVGAGLAGSEAAWQIAKKQIHVKLVEMRPKKMTPAHKTDFFGELVCSNSLRGTSLTNAVGLLKEELREMDSLIMACADKHRVPAGGALAVDREAFAKEITDRIWGNPFIDVDLSEEMEVPKGPVIIATGPLTSEKMASAISVLTGEEYLYFYDAAAPIVAAESIDYQKAFRASRYDKGDADYINCPLDQDEYAQFHQELISAELAPVKEFEKERFFEGCMPVEQLAKRGYQTLLFGPMKPVGLVDPKRGKEPFAVVQLRQDDRAATLYNIVGFQTHLKWPDQKRIFRLIPGLEQAEFVRYGVMHRNTFVNSPRLLKETMQMSEKEEIFFAGQITGVEGYVESTASGLVAGLNASLFVSGKSLLSFPQDTAIGALCAYASEANANKFQPMNINFGLLPPLGEKIKPKSRKNEMLAERALASLAQFKAAKALTF
ncbi:methylenetetrahydrofolate--tRNA-(uracil(54)-C(5))-methyltransferase (FADH(2)-oxidizing) TrmFO [Metallumcola ferriviriculae]|uniref:Methylenetetrahydrofolate--tRNA-(uracil-5-)-methyltransferase TrmFO n=1 Tax=Metallumcola ferriviriculae TaxID=3039180 RepID=A0AAU0UM85_9FIRM|nr:methylenetetrahydrofolate--tRNA-(uracil(54)-C(5))-methyltransferase (FADH(2)-oxidizing) TrmFO [Desulfitibacteraceae bacterium MK1]